MTWVNIVSSKSVCCAVDQLWGSNVRPHAAQRPARSKLLKLCLKRMRLSVLLIVATPPLLRMCCVARQFRCSFRPSHKKILHTHPLCLTPPLSIISTFLSCLSHSTHTHTYDPASGFIPVKKKTLPWSGLWNRVYVPSASGSNEEKSCMLNCFRGETNKKGKTAKPLWLAASRQRESEGKECKGSVHVTFNI